MKALTVRQPWAQLIALGVKTIETRSWSTKYRGPLAIHAGTHQPRIWWSQWGSEPKSSDGAPWIDEFERYCPLDSIDEGDDGWFAHRWRQPLGAVVAICRLVNVLPIRDSMDPDTSGDYVIVGRHVGMAFINGNCWGMVDQVPYGDFTPGNYAWILGPVRPVPTPVPVKGKQGLWNWDASELAIAEGITA